MTSDPLFQVVFHAGRRGGSRRRWHANPRCQFLVSQNTRQRPLRSKLGSMLAKGAEPCKACVQAVVPA